MFLDRFLSRFLFSFFLKIDVLGCDQSSIAKRQQAAAVQCHISSHRRKCRVHNEVLLQVLLQCFHVIHFDDHTDRLAGKHKKAPKQRFGGLAANVGLISFVKFLHLIVREAFHLFVRKLGVEHLFCFVGGYKNSQLFAFFWNVVGRERKRKIGGFRATSVSFMTSLSAFRHAVKKLTEKYLFRKGGARGSPERNFFFFQHCHQFFLLFRGRLACVVPKDGFHGFARRSVKQKDGGHVFVEWLCDAGDLLG